MRFLPDYVMRGRMSAILAVVVLAMGSLLLVPLTSPLGYLSGAAVALVTLRMGPAMGAFLVAMATLASALLGLVTMQTALLGLGLLLGLWLPVWVAATVLRNTVSLALALLAAVGFGAAFVVGFHLTVSDPVAWWQQMLLELPGLAGDPTLQENSEQVARLMTGLLAAGLAIGTVIALLVGRWWQAIQVNPGGFQEEFHGLRLPQAAAVAALAILVMGLFLPGTMGALFADLIWLMVLLYLLQGLAVTHALVLRREAHVGWLVGLYAVLVFTFPLGVLMVAALGFVDGWANFRAVRAGDAE